jgi:signal peptidase I
MKRRAMKRVLSIIGVLAIVLIGAIGVGSIIARVALGAHAIVILSNSMRPEWARGSLVYVAPEPVAALRLGQAIAYRPPVRIFNGIVVHQVVAIHRTAYGAIVKTKGLVNSAPDPWADRLSGQVYHVVATIPYLGMIYIWASYWRFDVAVLATLVFVVGMVLAYRWARSDATEQDVKEPSAHAAHA